jgi:selenium metabolism protein YedF
MYSMKIVDCSGKTCPLPVVETKRVLEEDMTLGEIVVLVDNPVSCENVMRFLESQGFSVTSMDEDGKFRIEGTRSGAGPAAPAAGGARRLLVFIDGETMGRGSDELGQILMRSFILTLKELNPLPWRIIFVNSGVKLAVESSPLVVALQDLTHLGVEILSCGTCLDYYRLKEKLRVGRVSNMYEIASSFLEATNVIKP